MLVIKMLKKASGKNNIELANYLGKSRNTITSWENDESSIPVTEKKKISARFNFVYYYWNVGLNETNLFYQQMYSDIKNGYLLDCENNKVKLKNRIDEILNYCDNNYEKNINDSDNEFEHYKYISSLINGVDPISNKNLREDHFINNLFCSVNIDEIFNKENKSIDDLFEFKLNKLKNWRTIQAEKENVKSFQILSDSVLESIVDKYLNGNLYNDKIKNFPINGVKWNKYFYEIEKILVD